MLRNTLDFLREHVQLPRCCDWPTGLGRAGLKADLAAGLTGAVIVLPQGLAFALIAGLPPQYGLYTAIVPTLLAAVFGSSHHLISGPTTAISIVILANLSPLAEPFSPRYLELTLTLTFLAGLFQLTLGMARMGALINFVSRAVMAGFTAGAAVLIGLGQVHHFLGVALPRQSMGQFLASLPGAVSRANLACVAVGGLSMAVALYCKRRHPRVPGLLFAMLLSGALAWALGGEAAGIRMAGALPGGLPPVSWPFAGLDQAGDLIPGALAVAMLGLAEAVAIARAVAARTGQRLDNNQEFLGQGLSNMGGSFFSSYASSGSFTRTGVNLESGARTPLAAVISAFAVALAAVLIAPATAHLPLAGVAGALFVVAGGLVHAREIDRIVRTSSQEALVMAITAVSCLAVNLEFALFAGVMLSLLFYLNRTSHPHFITLASEAVGRKRHLVNIARHPLPECPQVKILRLDGSIFFGAVNHIAEELHHILKEAPQRHVILVASGVNFIDVTGCQMVFQQETSLEKEGRRLYLCSLKQEVLNTLRLCGCMQGLGRDQVFDSKSEAVREVLKKIDFAVCCRCEAKVFKECQDIASGFCALD
ncbi:putative sulfate transporter [Fundidesulfovibrio magnetotacticus]|uniref:Putative sulfate transporter n=1 Tax=Fundidesulfovibrio magnetotacticus TaxID=2730080 RepID=A0A6V8LS95_9BACT|nr:SulP family inorganic anion transporter [Fundidesulfovibrio magnetotacticus]GFK94614.1 putative sulfate transporter [Fundidesulfovibrio magnetotacticus]